MSAEECFLPHRAARGCKFAVSIISAARSSASDVAARAAGAIPVGASTKEALDCVCVWS